MTGLLVDFTSSLRVAIGGVKQDHTLSQNFVNADKRKIMWNGSSGVALASGARQSFATQYFQIGARFGPVRGAHNGRPVLRREATGQNCEQIARRRASSDGLIAG